MNFNTKGALNMAITREQIHQVANQLAEQGIKPTQTNVREALGGGSFTTIAEALREWRAEQETVEQLQAVVIPADISERSNILIAQLWETAQTIANERLAKEREGLAHKEALLIADNDEMQRIVETLESEQNELTIQLDELNEQGKQYAEKLAQSEQQNAQQAEQIRLLETRLNAQQSRADELAEQGKQQAEKISQLTTHNATLTAEKTAQADTIERLKNELTNEQGDTKTEQQKAEKHRADLSELNSNLANLQGQNKTLAEQLTKAETQVQAQAEKIEKLTAELATAKANKTKSSNKTKPQELKEGVVV